MHKATLMLPMQKELKFGKLMSMGSSCPLLKALSSLHLDGSLTWSLLTALFITQTGSSSLSTLFSALLYKIDLTEGDQSNKVNVIEVTGGTLRFGDGIELLSPTKIVIAGSLNIF